jgi:YbbR domain-containing protein
LQDGWRLPIDVTGLRQTQNISVTVPNFPGVSSVVPNTVTAAITIAPSTVSSFSNIPVQIINAPKGKVVSIVQPTPLTIRVSGPASVISKLSSADLTAYADASNVTTTTTSLPVQVKLPNWVTVVQLSANTVGVHVTNS